MKIGKIKKSLIDFANRSKTGWVGVCASSFLGAIYGEDLDYVRSVNRLLDVVGCDGELQLHLQSTKSPMRYLVDSQALISLPRNEKCDSAPLKNDVAKYGH